MRVFAWVCVVAGVPLAVVAFLITAHTPSMSPWPSLVLGLCLTMLGVVLRAVKRNLTP